jgi:AraC family transcriptional regulator
MVNYYRAIQRAIHYVEEHLCDPFTVEDVSKAAFQSRWHFQRVFRLVTGHSLYQYVQRRRLAEAGSDLILKKSKVIDIAFKYQYGSPEAFTRAFVKHYGQPPKDYKSIQEHQIFPPLQIGDKGPHPNYSRGDIAYKPVSRSAITLFGKIYRTSMRDQQNEKMFPWPGRISLARVWTRRSNTARMALTMGSTITGTTRKTSPFSWAVLWTLPKGIFLRTISGIKGQTNNPTP